MPSSDSSSASVVVVTGVPSAYQMVDYMLVVIVMLTWTGTREATRDSGLGTNGR
jgi:hypothetical protein